MRLVCERHATSKLRNYEDLQAMETYGFRGEGLASISQVAKVTVSSRTSEDSFAHTASYSGMQCDPPFAAPAYLFTRLEGKMVGSLTQSTFNYSHGTRIVIRNMFEAIPQRQRKLRPADEAAKVIELVVKYAIHHP